MKFPGIKAISITSISIALLLTSSFTYGWGFVYDRGVDSLHMNPANLTYAGLFESSFGIKGRDENTTEIFYNTAFFGLSGLSYIFNPSDVDNYGILGESFLLGKGRNFALGCALNLHFDSSWNVTPWFDLGLTWHPVRFLGLGMSIYDAANNGGAYIQRHFKNTMTLRYPGLFTLRGYLDWADEPDDFGLMLSVDIIEGGQLDISYENTSNGEVFKGGFTFFLGNAHTAMHGGTDIDATGIEYSGILSLGTKSRPKLPSLKKKAKITIEGKYSAFGKRGLFKNTPSIERLIKNIVSVLDQKKLRTLYIVIRENSLSMAHISRVASAIERVRNSGKTVISILDHGYIPFKDYLLALEGDVIFANPESSLYFGGIYSQSLYYGGLLDLLKIDAQIVKPDDCIYKSATETMMKEGPSDPALENKIELLGDLFSISLDRIIKRRKLNQEGARLLVDNYPVLDMGKAKQFDLIDDFFYSEDILEEDESIREYRSPFQDDFYSAKPSIAVIPMMGMILDTEESSPLLGDVIGAKSFTKMFRKIEKMDNIKAVLLYIDSPGGDAFASDRIHHALTRLQNKGKKVYVYMESVAASGGYYIAAPADRIYANPYVITGSIGIYGGKYYLGRFFRMLKIKSNTVKFGEKADFFDPFDKWEDEDLLLMKNHLEVFYTTFKSKVSEGREIPAETVAGLAGGRVYSSARALKSGLVDQISTFDNAVKEICEENSIRFADESIRVFTTGKGPLSPLFNIAKIPDLTGVSLWMLYLGE